MNYCKVTLLQRKIILIFMLENDYCFQRPDQSAVEVKFQTTAKPLRSISQLSFFRSEKKFMASINAFGSFYRTYHILQSQMSGMSKRTQIFFPSNRNAESEFV